MGLDEGTYKPTLDSEGCIIFDETTSFVLSQWISRNQLFNTAPAYISNVYKKLVAIPPAIQRKILPPLGLAISDLLQSELPSFDDETTTIDVSSFFSKEKLAANFDHTLLQMWSTVLPSPATLSKVSQLAGQAWLDGYTSITMPGRFTHTPFWIVTYFLEVLIVKMTICRWLTALKWVELQKRQSHKGNCSVFDSVTTTLSKLSWGRTVSSRTDHKHVSNLMTFLSDEWFSTLHLNFMTNNLLHRIQQKVTTLNACPIYITDAWFSPLLIMHYCTQKTFDYDEATETKGC
jgi:hypothetical protein